MAGGVLELLRPTLGLLTTHTALKHPALAKGGPGGSLAGASAMMQLRLLQAYSLLPATLVAASADTEALSALCLEAIKAAAASVSLDLLKPALHAVLDPEDASLGPWHGGRDPLEKALLHFCGGVGSPIATAWQMGLRLGTGYAADAPSTGHAVQQGVEYCTTALYPQPLALAPCLLIVQSQVLGVLLRAGPPAAQSGIADALLAIARSVPATRKERDLPKRLTALLSAAIPVVAGLGSGPLAAGLPPFRASMELAEKVRSLAEEVASESAAGGLVLQRAAADLFAACARVGSDAASLQLVKGLCQNAAETASLPQRATLALAAGSAGRAIGGMGLAAALPVAVQTLAALADASDKVIAPWVLQALLSLAHAAGLAFVPHVKQSLAVAQVRINATIN